MPAGAAADFHGSSPKVLLIIPCFNEALRLKSEIFLHETPNWVDLLFANDGSTDETAYVIDELCKKRQGFWAFHASKNQGKAGVIQSGYDFLKKQNKLSGYEWIGFWDADLATPLHEVQNFLTYQKSFSPKSLALFGCRLGRYGANIERSLLRHYLSRAFVTFTDGILGIKAYDSQCGAKLFHRTIADKAFSEPFISKWVFDLELILRVGSENVLEIPVFKWNDVPGSKVKIAREIFRVFKDLLKIKEHYLSHKK